MSLAKSSLGLFLFIFLFSNIPSFPTPQVLMSERYCGLIVWYSYHNPAWMVVNEDDILSLYYYLYLRDAINTILIRISEYGGNSKPYEHQGPYECDLSC